MRFTRCLCPSGHACLSLVPPRAEGRARAEEVGAAVRGRARESIQVVLSEESSVVKSKVNLRIQ